MMNQQAETKLGRVNGGCSLNPPNSQATKKSQPTQMRGVIVMTLFPFFPFKIMGTIPFLKL